MRLLRFLSVAMLAVAMVFCARFLWDNWYAPVYASAQVSPFQLTQTTLISPDHPMPEDYSPELDTYGSISVHETMRSSLENMVNAAEKDGIALTVVHGYLSPEQTRALFAATDQSGSAEPEPAEPSEHWAGLAIDVEATEQATQWLLANMHKYGFILRYPENKTKITGVAYQPQHLRYVGTQAAKIMHQKKLCLEEYLKLYPA